MWAGGRRLGARVSEPLAICGRSPPASEGAQVFGSMSRFAGVSAALPEPSGASLRERPLRLQSVSVATAARDPEALGPSPAFSAPIGGGLQWPTDHIAHLPDIATPLECRVAHLAQAQAVADSDLSGAQLVCSQRVLEQGRTRLHPHHATRDAPPCLEPLASAGEGVPCVPSPLSTLARRLARPGQRPQMGCGGRIVVVEMGRTHRQGDGSCSCKMARCLVTAYDAPFPLVEERPIKTPSRQCLARM